jgi:hypothetical protein
MRSSSIFSAFCAGYCLFKHKSFHFQPLCLASLRVGVDVFELLFLQRFDVSGCLMLKGDGMESFLSTII